MARKNSEQGNDPVERQIRLKIVVRLTAAAAAAVDHGIQQDAGRGARINGLAVSEHGPGGIIRRPRVARRHQGVCVRRVLVQRDRDALGAARLPDGRVTEPGPLSHVDGRTAAQVGQGERALAVSPISGSNESEQRVVLRDRQNRAIAILPAHGRKRKTDQPQFTDVRAHAFSSESVCVT